MAVIGTDRKPNRLQNEKSPYLLQHAYNPVDWYPWGDEAFQKARQEDKPVFLSLGYSTCHWCHVMERESFEDTEVANYLNEHFISVKVDREERPDVDHIYMTVCQAITGHGGWPLTIIMTPDKRPFFAGTYFPKRSRRGMPGLLDVLEALVEKWKEDRGQLVEAGNRVTNMLQEEVRNRKIGTLDEEALVNGYEYLSKNFDDRYGGFGHVPKFPTPHNLTFLMRYWKYAKEDKALAMVEKTLSSMRAGGIYDHLGYGFSRYSTDEKWLVPHFEKMLYDNALLAMAYLEAYQITERDEYAETAREIFSYILRDMTSREGAFYSAEDADSEGEEGKFYVWTPQEITQVLGEQQGNLLCQWYDVTDKGNFEGKNILHRIDAEQRPYTAPMEPDTWERVLSDLQQQLFVVREKRVHPYKDDKILTSWNGLMIAAFAMGYRVLHDLSYLEAAVKAADFIWMRLRNENGRLLARYRDGEAAYLGYIDDYAFMIWALIELYQADTSPRWLQQALELQEQQNLLFWDSEEGGYFFYGSDAEELLTRPKEIYDGATPSGNSVSALNLLRLARLTGREDFTDQAEKLLQAFSGNISAMPAGYTFALMALLFARQPGKEVVVVAERPREHFRHELEPLYRVFTPETVFLYRLAGKEYEELASVAPFVREMTASGGEPTFYVCENFACQPPTTDMAKVRELL
ncbi:thioredoxin domain-containing protein [Heliobacterium chlorum]|uniref:Thioredoxin domain-containing protein n=1 Tax=Heliobacterium chlorum TaxID=2698 RepID=A0ABR7T1G3_HELCL|nr:thioredoxin domain-containing protein [Heliobacterium chlorum]MBC9784625.1 thioredoxin domain-containing protein [Heliobacterium chlorum]